jgi:ankyrin repeat protein
LPPGGLTPLLFAARENCLACLPVLIKAGADLNATTPEAGIKVIAGTARNMGIEVVD